MDAFVVRATLVPAFMRLAGEANWWAPAPLRRFYERFGVREIVDEEPPRTRPHPPRRHLGNQYRSDSQGAWRRSAPSRRRSRCSARATPSGSRSGPAIRRRSSTRSGSATTGSDLDIFGALLLDLYPLFSRPGVRYVSGFFGPAERVLVDSGARIEFVPADFRRFVTVAEQFAPRIVATCATPPDADGWMSLSLHAGATVREMQRAAEDPDRLLIVEANPHLPRTLGLPPDHPHRVHVDAVDVIVAGDRPPFPLLDPPASEVERAIAAHARDLRARRLHACRRASARSRRPSSRCSRRATAATTACTRRCSRPGSWSSTGRARSRTGARVSTTGSPCAPSRSARPSCTSGSTGTRRSASCRSTW